MNQDSQSDNHDYFTPAPDRDATSSEWQYTSGQLQQSSATQPTANPNQDTPELSWSASEFINHEKQPSWYAILALGSIVVAGLMYLVTRDWISAIVVIFLAIVTAIYASAKPKTSHYSITAEGLLVNGQIHSYENFKSFSVIEETGLPFLQLLSRRRFMVPLNIYAPPDQIDKIVDSLTDYIAYDQKHPDFVDRLTKKIRF